MLRLIGICAVLSIAAVSAGTASAKHRVLILQPGETRTFTSVSRGDTVACASLRLVIQRTPTYVHASGAPVKALAYRYTWNRAYVLSLASPRQQRVIATCRRH